MSTVKSIKILDSNFQGLGETSNYEFFQWERNLRSVDTFEIHINRYKTINSVSVSEMLVVGNWIVVDIGGKTRAGRIEQRKLGLTQDGKVSEDYVIKGYSGGQPLLYRYIFEDTIEPDLIVVTLSPSDAQTGVDINANLIITFNQPVFGDTGTVKLYKADNTLIQTWVANTLDIDGNVVTINPSAPLDSGTGYYVLIESTAFKNANEVYFAGYLSSTNWNFTSSTGGSGGSTSYLDLNDTPTSRTGKKWYVVQVQSNGLEDSYAELVAGTGVAITIEDGKFTFSSTGGGSSPLTTKGDLYTFSTTDARLPVGNDGDTLIPDSSEATGLKWVANPKLVASTTLTANASSVTISGLDMSADGDIYKIVINGKASSSGVVTMYANTVPSTPTTNTTTVRFQQIDSLTSTGTMAAPSGTWFADSFRMGNIRSDTPSLIVGNFTRQDNLIMGEFTTGYSISGVQRFSSYFADDRRTQTNVTSLNFVSAFATGTEFYIFKM